LLLTSVPSAFALDDALELADVVDDQPAADEVFEP
jgi:hypothetical protein